MLDTLLTFAPLFFCAVLAIIWGIGIFVVVILWLVHEFKESKIITGLVMLLLLIALPVGSWFLGRSFLRAEVFTGEEGEGLSTVSAYFDELFDSDETPEQGADSSAASCRPPEDYSDEELLALAGESFDNMLSMWIAWTNGHLFPIDYIDSIILEHQPAIENSGHADFPLFRVKDYTTIEELEAALEDVWYHKFSHKYPISVRGGFYIEHYNAVYCMAPDGLGGPGSPLIVDSIIERKSDEVFFTGHWERDDGTSYGTAEFSLVYEDGRWKYGYI